MAEFTKVNSIRIKRVGTLANCMEMETCMSAISHKIRSMGKDHCIGSAYVQPLAPRNLVLRFSSIMEIGGAGYLMARENIKKPMVIYG